MWFLGSFFALTLIAIFCCLVGNTILYGLYRGYIPKTIEVQIYSILLGTGAVILLFGWASYLNIAGKYSGPFIAIIALLVFTFLLVKKNLFKDFFKNRISLHYLIIVLIFIMAAAISLEGLLFFHAYNPYNDTFSSISISDYLQYFSFSRPVIPDAYSPILTQPFVWQSNHLRMGALFFLAFVQSVMPVSRAYEIYPAVIGWGLILNIAAIYLACRKIMRLPRLFSLGAVILMTFSFTPLYFALNNGFFAEIYGMAFLVYGMSTLTYCLRKNSPLFKGYFSQWIQCALAFSFLMSVYSELFPIAFIVFIAASLFKLINSDKKLSWLLTLCLLILSIGIFSNIEVYRMVRGIFVQINTLYGWNINYSWLKFFGMASGLNPDCGLHKWLYNILVFVLAVIFIGGLKNSFKDIRKNYVWIFNIALFFLMFLYFAFFKNNPWNPTKLGQTWDMFKLTNWVYPIILLGVIRGIYCLPQKRYVLGILLIIFTAFFFPLYYKMLRNVTASIRITTHSQSPFSAYQQFAEMVQDINPIQHQPIEISANLSELHSTNYIKHREMLAYFIYPNPVTSDWREDTYIYPYLLKLKIVNIGKHLIIQPYSNNSTKTGILPAGVIAKNILLTHEEK